MGCSNTSGYAIHLNMQREKGTKPVEVEMFLRRYFSQFDSFTFFVSEDAACSVVMCVEGVA